jgi:hypothetical protein
MIGLLFSEPKVESRMKEKLEENKKENPVMLCGISLESLPYSFQITILLFGVFFFYVL